VLDKLSLVSNTGNGLFFVDKDLKGMVGQSQQS